MPLRHFRSARIDSRPIRCLVCCRVADEVGTSLIFSWLRMLESFSFVCIGYN